MTDLDELTGESLQIGLGSEPGAVLLMLAGELDLATAPRLAAALAEVAGRDEGRVVLDLTHLSFMDSTGLSLIVRTDRSARAARGVLVLRHPQSQVRRLLELADALSRLTVED
jgi:anti-sigma B factor antagonist